MNYHYLPNGKVKCPYCHNELRADDWTNKNSFEKDAMTGSIKKLRNGYIIYSEDWLCGKCERNFQVKISMLPQVYTVRFKK